MAKDLVEEYEMDALLYINSDENNVHKYDVVDHKNFFENTTFLITYYKEINLFFTGFKAVNNNKSASLNSFSVNLLKIFVDTEASLL